LDCDDFSATRALNPEFYNNALYNGIAAFRTFIGFKLWIFGLFSFVVHELTIPDDGFENNRF